MTFALATLAGVVLAASPRVDFQAIARSEARVRAVESNDGATQDAELALSPRAVVLLGWGVTRAEVEYAPFLVLRALPAENDRELLHNAAVRLAHRPDRLTTLRLNQEAGYGQYRFRLIDAPSSGGPGGAGPTPGTGGLPPLELVDFVRSDTRLIAEFLLSRLTTLSTSAGWEVSGGADDASRQRMPLQRGPTAEASLSQRLSRNQMLAAVASYRDRFFMGGGGSRISLGQLRITWDREIDPDSGLTVSTGAGVGRERAAGAGWTPWYVLPDAQASLSRRFRFRGNQLSGTLSGHLAPTINPFTATLEQRVEARVTLDWARSDLLRGGLYGSGSSRVFSTPEDRQQVGLIGASAGVRLSSWSALEGTLAWSWERAGDGGPVRRQWQAGLSFVAMADSTVR